MRYFIKTPWWLKKLNPGLIWDMKTDQKILYLTFDDGPHPQVTGFVLDLLKKYNAKGTFFCIGKNVEKHPDVYQRICEEGHAVGNHTYSHLNGWKTKDEEYLNDISLAAKSIQSNLFRPPYGRITNYQAKSIINAMGVSNAKIIMWDILSADFDTNIKPQKSMKNVISNARPGSIIVFHDTEKAFPRLEATLPATLDFFIGKGYQFNSLSKISIHEKVD